MNGFRRLAWGTVLLLVLAGCSSYSLDVSCDEFYETPEQSREVTVDVGDTFSVTLCSNPSTGFSWMEQAAISDPSVLAQTDHQFQAPGEGEDPPPPGTPGQQTWIFKALAEGKSKLLLDYSQPWEGGEKGAWTYLLEVIVK